MREFIYSNIDDMHQLVMLIRKSPIDDTEYIMNLGDDIFIKTTAVRCYLNALIFQVIDSYGVSHKRENRVKFVFIEDYKKGNANIYMNRILDTIYYDEPDFPDKEIFMAHCLADVKMCTYVLVVIGNGIVSMDHSLFDYIDTYRKNKIFKSMIKEKIYESDDDPWDIKEKLDAMIKSFTESVELSPITEFLESGTKVSHAQLQFLINYGLPPNYITMKTILPPIDEGLLNGITKKWNMFILDMISRLAIIVGKKDIKDPGLTSKRTGLAFHDTRMNRVEHRDMIDDCGNTDYLIVTIKDKKDLLYHRFKGIYDPETHEKLGFVDKNRTDLIGQTLHLRTYMSCKGDVICKACAGENWRMISDNRLFKVNLSTYELDNRADEMQYVISVKHHSSGILKDIKVNYGDYKDIHIKKFIEITNNSIITKMAYDVLIFNPLLKVDFVKKEDNTKKRTRYYYELYINDQLFSIDTVIKPIPGETHKFKVDIPNDSPIVRAANLNMGLEKHSGKHGDFNTGWLKDKTVMEQITVVYEYLRTKIRASHISSYECLIHALVKDIDDPSSRITKDTVNILFTHVSQALNKPERARTLAPRLIHGYIKKGLNVIDFPADPSEFDILYQQITDRTSAKKNMNDEFTCVLLDTGLI